VSVEVEVMGRRMAKALEDADRRKMKYAIIVGESELSEGAVVVRDLAKRQQSTVKVERIIDLVKG
jgi:histidyl-tRNA synthetase